MAARLCFELINKPHPYADEPSTQAEGWGQIVISVHNEEGKHVLFDSEWNLDELGEWFAENQAAICQETLTVQGNTPQPTESLAQALWRFVDREFTEAEDEEQFRWFDALDQYRARHSLRSALPGSRMPNIILGCNHGVGEISLRSDDADWAYQFDMQDFVSCLRTELRRFLMTWQANAQGDLARARATTLLEKLATAPPTECCGPAW